MRKQEDGELCTDECRSPMSERNRFFTGKYMTARDFRADQDYTLEHHRLHNRLLHGWGVACGFGVTTHPSEECRDWVIVGPGVALDCFGRELILRDRTPVRIQMCHDAAASADDAHTDEEGADQSASQQLLLCAVYAEEEIEPVPVIYDDCRCEPNRREANRIRETVRLEAHPFADFDPSCWGVPGGGDTRCRDDCDTELPAGAEGCVEPECECGVRVPLALLERDDAGCLVIDTQGRRRLRPPPENLTHVVHTNWVHGGTMTLDELVELRTLKIHFDRKIAAAEGFATGINSETLLVQHAGESDNLEFVPYDVEHPPQLIDGCRAEYAIDLNFLGGRRRGGLMGSTIYVTLLADMVLDCHGQAVDGNHVAGRLPSGNGAPGGTFRSWFRIQSSYNEESAS